MSFYCRAVNTSNGQIFYLYRDIGYFQSLTNSSPPVTYSDADTICKLGNSAYTAIDAQILYSSGSPFVFSQIDPSVMSEAVAAGFILSYGLIALAWGGRIIVKSIWGRF